MPTYPYFCGLDCGGDACPLLASVDAGGGVKLTNNPAAGKFIKGCLRSQNQPKIHYSSERILKPLLRDGPRGSGRFREASWDEALSRTADALGEITARYGGEAVLDQGSAGCTGVFHATQGQLSRFLSFLGGGTNLTGSYSNGAASFTLPYLLGKEWKTAGWDAATMRDSAMIVLWGANVLETRMGAEVPQRLVESSRRTPPAQIVVIDPRCTATARQTNAWWIPIRPGTDAAMMLAVLFVLITENRVDREFITAHSAGFEELEAYVLGKDGGEPRTPQWAETHCGVPADEIVRFARDYSEAKPAMIFPGYSIQRVFAGEETFRLTVALQVATGNFGVRGGSTGALNSRLSPPRVGTLPVPPTPSSPKIPIQCWPDAVLEGRAGGYPSDIHAIYTAGGNLINMGSGAHKAAAAFQKVDFAVAHELFLTTTARHCDVVFPAASSLEKEDIGIPWLGNYLLYKPQILPGRGEARTDYDILCALAEKMGFLEQFSERRTPAEWIQLFLDQSEIPDQAAFRRTGLYLGSEQERVGLQDFSRNPAGHPLSTPSGKVEIASAAFHQETGFPQVPTWREPPLDPRYSLSLITPKTPRFTHSQGWNLPELREKVRHRLEIHPADAAERGIREGSSVRIFNAEGTTLRTAHLSEEIVRGTVCLLEGSWIDDDPARTGVDRAGSANVLTSTQGSLPSHGCVMDGVGVEVCLD